MIDASNMSCNICSVYWDNVMINLLIYSYQVVFVHGV